MVSTADHLFFAHNYGWLPASEITQADMLVGLDAADMVRFDNAMPMFVSKLTNPVSESVLPVFNATESVYNIFPEATHTYIVGKEAMIVHSCVGMNTLGVMHAATTDHDSQTISKAVVVAHATNYSTSHDSLLSRRTANVASSLLVLDSFTPTLGVTAWQADTLLLAVRSLTCLKLGEWNEIVGIWDLDKVVILDHNSLFIHVLSLPAISEAIQANGVGVCLESSLIYNTIRIRDTQIPVAGLIGHHDDIYIAFFLTDTIARYSLKLHNSLFESFTVESVFDRGSHNLAWCGSSQEFLCVSFSNILHSTIMFMVSPKVTETLIGDISRSNDAKVIFGPSSMLVLPVGSQGELLPHSQEIQRLESDMRNIYSFHRHEASNILFVLFAGDRELIPGGFARINEATSGFAIDHAVRLPVGADPARFVPDPSGS